MLNYEELMKIRGDLSTRMFSVRQTLFKIEGEIEEIITDYYLGCKDSPADYRDDILSLDDEGHLTNLIDLLEFLKNLEQF